MEPTSGNIGTTGAGRTEGQSLSPDTTAKNAATRTDNRTANQDTAAGSTANHPNQSTGYGRTSNG